MKLLIKLGLVLFICLMCIGEVDGQVYVEGGNTRHRFAQTYVGTHIRAVPSFGSTIIRDQSIPEKIIPGMQSVIAIGGLHFWGHVDFHIYIPMARLKKSLYQPRVETGVRLFPWRIEKNKIRPYAGVSWMPSGIQIGEGANLYRHEWPVQTGLVFQYRNVLVEGGVSYSFTKEVTYYESLQQTLHVQSSPYILNVGVKWLFDSTLSAERDWESGYSAILTDTLAKLNRLNSWTFGMGISSAFFLKSSSHTINETPFLHAHRLTRIFPDMSVGYYFHKRDIQVSLSFRPISSSQEGLGMKQNARRLSCGIEAYKFLSDYHGFVPFAGVILNAEWLSLHEKLDNGLENAYRTSLVRPGLVFGWDIRPNRLQSFYLRTNLRWTPNLELSTIGNLKFRFDQLEFNFIQAVFMLNRW